LDEFLYTNHISAIWKCISAENETKMTAVKFEQYRVTGNVTHTTQYLNFTGHIAELT
jgi:hypothetical protein